MSDNDKIIIIEEKKKNKFIFIFFFGIIFFIAIYFPFFGQNLRYESSMIFIYIFSRLGTILTFFGIIFILWGIMSFFLSKPLNGFRYLLMGIVLLTIGGYFMIPGRFGSGEEVPKGYH
ncbi:MAG: hypothetical protein EU532_12835 [Promethearchaeota archaeon]|nr:MAG: hypothetical protein EU532_12835 [Candidatus Lokiarchaeota archaeon]